MLGLSNTISSLGTSSSAVVASRGSGSSEPDPLFLSSVIPANFFTPDSIQGTLSLTADQSAPDGSGGWLKGVFSQDQTSFSGMVHLGFDSEITGGLVSGDSYKISFDFFLNSGTNGNGEDFWPSAPTTTTLSLGGEDLAKTYRQDLLLCGSKHSLLLLDLTITIYMFFGIFQLVIVHMRELRFT